MLVSPGGVSDATARAQATAAQTTADSKATLQIGALAASTTTAPNATAVMTAIAAGTGGASVTLRTAASNAIPLDTVGNGRAMPLVAGQTILINAPTTLTIAAGAIEGASCEVSYYVASTITLPTTYPGIPAGAAVVVNGTISVGFRYRLVFGISAGDLVIFCFQQAAVDAVAPTLSSASVANATPAQIDLVFNKSMFATWSSASAFLITGHPITGVTRLTATTGFLTSSTVFVNGESARTLAYTQLGTNNMQDLAGNFLLSIVASAITNNVGASVPIFISSTPSAATVGTPYSYTYAATNTTSYPLVSGTFPAGLTYNPATGNISGTPTTVSAVVHMVSAVGPGGTTNGPSSTLTVNASAATHGDTFIRANSLTSLGAPSDGGVAWVTYGPATWGISGNQAYVVSVSSAGDNVAIRLSGSATIDHTIDLLYRSGSNIGAVVRGASDTYCIEVSPPTNPGTGWTVYSKVAGGYTLEAALVGPSVVDGTTYTTRVTVSGSTLTAYVGGVSIGTCTITQAANASNTGVGMRQDSGNSTTRFGNQVWV